MRLHQLRHSAFIRDAQAGHRRADVDSTLWLLFTSRLEPSSGAVARCVPSTRPALEREPGSVNYPVTGAHAVDHGPLVVVAAHRDGGGGVLEGADLLIDGALEVRVVMDMIAELRRHLIQS